MPRGIEPRCPGFHSGAYILSAKAPVCLLQLLTDILFPHHRTKLLQTIAESKGIEPLYRINDSPSLAGWHITTLSTLLFIFLFPATKTPIIFVASHSCTAYRKSCFQIHSGEKEIRTLEVFTPSLFSRQHP